jgi:multidrug resistance efflux pump
MALSKKGLLIVAALATADLFIFKQWGERRQAELRQAEANLRDLLTGARSQEIMQAGAAVDEARAERERAKREWGCAQTLYETGDISTTQYDQAQTLYGVASAALKAAEDRLAPVDAEILLNEMSPDSDAAAANTRE